MMKKFIKTMTAACAAVFLSTASASPYTITITKPYHWPVVEVVDGDTVKVEAKWLPPELGTVISVRIIGVDTPEKGWRAKCVNEANLGEAATSFVMHHLQEGATPELLIDGWDKYGGRIDGDFVINGQLLSDMLIKEGLAHPYDGKGPRQSWCD